MLVLGRRLGSSKEAVMFRGSTEIRDAYRDETIARTYLDQRFSQPLGALLHARQAKALTRVVSRVEPKAILEIAPGPARLTIEIAPSFDGRAVILDASPQMLAEARRRLAPVSRRTWHALLGDVFHLPFREEFDLVYTFRLIRHFDRDDRIRIYRQISAGLRPQGVLVFDAVNEVVSAPLRAASPAEYKHFDALLRPSGLRQELEEAGLRLESLEGVQRRYPMLKSLQILVAPRSKRLARLAMEAVERVGGGEPLEWIVTARRP